MHRLFVAIRPPRDIREQLLGMMGGVRGARWQSDDQLHITLRFIGEVDRHAAEDVAAALGSIHHLSFEVALNGIGSFERRGRAEILWAGVTPQDSVQALHKKVDQALIRVGLEPERRAYHPHVTLARLGRSAGPVAGLVEEAGGFASPVFTVDAFGLYESELTPEGAVYTLVERYSLA